MWNASQIQERQLVHLPQSTTVLITIRVYLPEFYHFIKTHKTGPEFWIPHRCLPSRTHGQAHLTDDTHLETSIYSSPSPHAWRAVIECHLIDVINRVPSEVHRTHPYPVNLEVSAPYTSGRNHPCSSRPQQSSRDPNTHQLSRYRVHPRSDLRKQPRFFSASALL